MFSASQFLFRQDHPGNLRNLTLNPRITALRKRLGILPEELSFKKAKKVRLST